MEGQDGRKEFVYGQNKTKMENEKAQELEKRKTFIPPSILHFLAGACGGAMSIIIVGHPLDTIKVRLQTMPPQTLPGEKPLFSGAWDCARKTVKKEGFVSLYRGMLAPLAIAMPSSAISFSSFNKAKSWQQREEGSILKPHQIFLAGAFSGALSQVLVVPGERIKCLLQIQRLSKGENKYSGPFDCIKQIYREEGFRGIYRGTCVGLLRDVPGVGMYYMTYECLLRFFTPAGKTRDTVGPFAIAIAGGLAGVNYWFLSLPQDTLKSRFQTAPPGTYPRGIRDVFKVTVKQEGYKALWRGFAPVMIRAFPACSVIYLGYEFALRFLNWSVPHLAEFGHGIFFD